MKKFSVLILTLAMLCCGTLVLGLSGCDKDPQPGPSEHVHQFTDYHYNGDATCTQDGTETGHCSCGEEDTRVKLGTKLTHQFTDYHYNEDATCTQDGTETGHCSSCGEEDTRVKEGTKLSHHYIVETDTPATCTEPGYFYEYCEFCYEPHSETRDPLGHETTFVAGTVSCLQAGTVDHWHCSRCEGNFVDQNGDDELYDYELESEKLDHDGTYYPEQAPTCTEPGVVEHLHCDLCENDVSPYGDVLDDLTIAPTNHYGHYRVYAEEPTCTEDGVLDHYHCDACGKDFADDDCEEVLQSTVDPKLGHDTHKVEARAVTCTQNGVEEHWLCDRCEKTFADQAGETPKENIYIRATGHQKQYVEEKAATCLEDGVRSHYHCDVCNKNFTYSDNFNDTEKETVVSPALGHAFGDGHYSYVAPTCTREGTKEHWYCSRCYKNFADDGAKTTQEIPWNETSIPATGHDLSFVAGTATCTEGGTIDHWHCAACEGNFAENDPESRSYLYNLSTDLGLGHNTSLVEGTATCTKAGTLDYYLCARCEEKFVDQEATEPARVFETSVPLPHQYTAQNMCRWCETVWETCNPDPFTYRYSEREGGYYITGFQEGVAQSSLLIIPCGHEDKYVIGLDDGALQGAKATSLRVAPTLRSIGDAVFKDSAITSIEWWAEDCKYEKPWNVSVGAFDGLQVKTLTFKGNVRTIDEYMFKGLPLGELNVPEGVVSIGAYAFQGCDQMMGIALPASIKTIGHAAFVDCTKLEKVNVSDIAAWCGVEFNDAYANPLYYVHHLYLMDEGKTTSTLVTDLVIPDGVKEIGQYAFYGAEDITSVDFNDVTMVGGYAFYECTKLESITFREATTIEMYVFYNCSELSTVTFEKGGVVIAGAAFGAGYGHENKISRVDIPTLEDWLTFTFHGSTATPIQNTSSSGKQDTALYVGGTKLTGEIKIPDSVTEIKPYAFARLAGAFTLTFGADSKLETIGESAFNYSGLTGTLTLPESLLTVGVSAFSCTSLEHVIFGDATQTIGKAAFELCSSLQTIELPAELTSIEYMLFYGASKLKEVTIPDKVTKVDIRAFVWCEELEKIVFGKAVEELTGASTVQSTATLLIDNYNGKRCVKLTTLAVADGNTHLQVVSGVLYKKDDMESPVLYPYEITAETLVIPDSVKYFNASIINYFLRDGLKRIEIGDSYESTFFGGGASGKLKSPTLEYIEVDEKNAKYCSIDGVLYNKAQTEIICAPEKVSGVIHIPAGITRIISADFGDGTHAAPVTAFVVDPENETYCSVDGVIYNKDKTKLIYVPNEIGRDETIGKVVHIPGTIGDSLDGIPNHVGGIDSFANRYWLNQVVVEEGVTKFGDQFYGSALSYLSLPHSLEKINVDTFGNCQNLKEVHYAGSTEEWNTIVKDLEWLWNTGTARTIICNNGSVYADGTEIVAE